MNAAKRTLNPLALALVPLALLSGCATQQAVSEKTDALAERIARLEDALKGTRQVALDTADARRLDRQALDARLAEQAQKLTPLESQLSAQAGKLVPLETRVAQLEARQQDAEQKLGEVAATARKALDVANGKQSRFQGKLIDSVALTADHFLYPLNSAELDSRDTALLDALAARLKALDHDYTLVIQGHNQETAVDEYNYLLGQARASAVMRYLHINGGIPLARMSAISYAAWPATPAANGAEKRRILVQVFE
jgi:outer membrane protein OmpA-like peptidoglycan-associated protein